MIFFPLNGKGSLQCGKTKSISTPHTLVWSLGELSSVS